MDGENRALRIPSGTWPYGHCQGIAVDEKRQQAYFSFTTALIKTDLSGRLIGSVTGLVGHLGCIALDRESGRIYGSLEYKNDEIGQGILRALGREQTLQSAFYIAMFDGERMDRAEMDACTDGVMRAAYLSEVARDYAHPGHRYGCSGIDGVTLGPAFGAPRGSKPYLYVAYGVYADASRDDNDHQILLQYDIDELMGRAAPLSQQSMHAHGPDKPLEKLFLFTGNTCYGVQNLEYDPYTGDVLLAVYPGGKPGFPNYALFIADGRQAPACAPLKGCPGESGRQLRLKPGREGFFFPYGSTGLCALGDGWYYISHDRHTDAGYETELRLYRWQEGAPFALV